jgi:hypothetical protein
MTDHEAPVTDERMRSIQRGDYTVSRSKDITHELGCGRSKCFRVYKGEVLLGWIADHPCGEWTFMAYERVPALRQESLLAILSFIDTADELYRLTQNGEVAHD